MWQWTASPLPKPMEVPMMRAKLVVLSLAALASTLFVAGGTAQGAGSANQSPEETLLAQVKTHPLAKLGPWLINLNDEYQQYARSSSGSRGRAAFKTRIPALN